MVLLIFMRDADGPMAELSPATTESSPYFSPQNEDKPRVPTPPPRPAFNFRPLPSKVVESYKDAFQKANPIDGVLPGKPFCPHTS